MKRTNGNHDFSIYEEMLILTYGLKYNVCLPGKTVKHSLTFWYIFDSTVQRHL